MLSRNKKFTSHRETSMCPTSDCPRMFYEIYIISKSLAVFYLYNHVLISPQLLTSGKVLIGPQTYWVALDGFHTTTYLYSPMKENFLEEVVVVRKPSATSIENWRSLKRWTTKEAAAEGSARVTTARIIARIREVTRLFPSNGKNSSDHF